VQKPATANGLGRPRDERIDTEVVSGVLNTLHRSGYGAVTIDGIARNRAARTHKRYVEKSRRESAWRPGEPCKPTKRHSRYKIS
jgi:hypothetical protein